MVKLVALFMVWAPLVQASQKAELLSGEYFFNVDTVFEATADKSKAQGAIEAVRLCKSKGEKFVQAYYIKQAGKNRYRLTDVFCHEEKWNQEVHELARAVIMRSRNERGLSVHRDGLALIVKMRDTAIDGFTTSEGKSTEGTLR